MVRAPTVSDWRRVSPRGAPARNDGSPLVRWLAVGGVALAVVAGGIFVMRSSEDAVWPPIMAPIDKTTWQATSPDERFDLVGRFLVDQTRRAAKEEWRTWAEAPRSVLIIHRSEKILDQIVLAPGEATLVTMGRSSTGTGGGCSLEEVVKAYRCIGLPWLADILATGHGPIQTVLSSRATDIRAAKRAFLDQHTDDFPPR